MKTKIDGVKLNGFNKMKLLHCDYLMNMLALKKCKTRYYREKRKVTKFNS